MNIAMVITNALRRAFESLISVNGLIPIPTPPLVMVVSDHRSIHELQIRSCYIYEC